MLIVLLVVTILIMVAIIGYAIKRRLDWDDPFWIVGAVFDGVAMLVVVIAMLVLGSTLAGAPAIDQKIEMHEAENNRIEIVIKAEVQNYLEHEHDTYVQIGNEDVEVLVIRYPELRSNELVQQQLQILRENNNIIRQLKTEKIDLIKVRWWLYFGH